MYDSKHPGCVYLPGMAVVARPVLTLRLMCGFVCWIAGRGGKGDFTCADDYSVGSYEAETCRCDSVRGHRPHATIHHATINHATLPIVDGVFVRCFHLVADLGVASEAIGRKIARLFLPPCLKHPLTLIYTLRLRLASLSTPLPPYLPAPHPPYPPPSVPPYLHTFRHVTLSLYPLSPRSRPCHPSLPLS